LLPLVALVAGMAMAIAVFFSVAFLVVIPEGDLLPSLSFPLRLLVLVVILSVAKNPRVCSKRHVPHKRKGLASASDLKRGALQCPTY